MSSITQVAWWVEDRTMQKLINNGQDVLHAIGGGKVGEEIQEETRVLFTLLRAQSKH